MLCLRQGNNICSPSHIFIIIKKVEYLHYIDNVGVKMFCLGPDCIACIRSNVPFDGLGSVKVFVKKSEANGG